MAGTENPAGGAAVFQDLCWLLVGAVDDGGHGFIPVVVQWPRP